MRTDSHRAKEAGAGFQRARRGRGDRGAILAESALITPFFILLLFGLIEFGGAFRDYLTLANAASQGTRTAAIQNNSTNADWDIVQAVKKASLAFPVNQIQRIVVFQATGPTTPVPSACKTGSAGSSTAGSACNLFLPADIGQATEPSTWLCPGTAAQATNPIAFWCANTRKVNNSDNSGAGPDYVGVYIEVTHPWITGLFGKSITITDTSITKLEPQGA
jgi:TadE-like protein